MPLVLTWLTSTGVIVVLSVLGLGALGFAVLWLSGWALARRSRPLGAAALRQRRSTSKVKGVLEPAGGQLRAALTERDVLWTRVVVDELFADDAWQETQEVVRGVPAVLREGDASAQVDLSTARVTAVRPEHVHLLDLATMTVGQRDALELLLEQPLPPAGRVREHTLCAGDEVVLCGTPQPALGGKGATRLVAPLALSDDEASLAYTWPEAQLGIPA